MAGGHGGARPGAGRPRKRVKHAGEVSRAEQAIADQLPRLIENLLYLAHGGYEQVEEHWEPAGAITVPGILRNADGTPELGPRGGVVRVAVPAYPDRPADELVLVSRRRTIAPPDRNANAYLVDRILGKPTETHEHSGEDGGPIKVYLNVDPDAV